MMAGSRKKWLRGRCARQRRLFLECLEQRVLLYAASLVDDSFDARQNALPQDLPVLANDIFEDGYDGERLITSVSYGSQGGQIQIAPGQRTLRYAPPADYDGSEQFVYFVDGRLSATVTVSVIAPLSHDSFTLFPDGQAHQLDVMVNDRYWSGYAGSRRITFVSETALGGDVEVTADGRSINYTPPQHSYGSDEFVYIVDDRYPAQVKIQVTNPLGDDRYREIIQNSENNPLRVLANDHFWTGYTGDRTISFVTETTQGASTTIADDGQSIGYTPAVGFSGWDDFRYVVDEWYEATVRIQVQRPVRDDRFEVDMESTDFPLMLTDNDTYSYYDSYRITRDVVDGVTSVGQPSEGGHVVIMPDGQGVWYWAPAGFQGEETFEYIADGKHSAMVSIRVTRPVRDDFFTQAVYEDTVGNVLDVLANDFKGNGYEGARRITEVSQTSAGGTVRMVDDGRTLVYSPASGFRGLDSFSYTVDGKWQAEVTVEVASPVTDDYADFCPAWPGNEYRINVLDNDHFNATYPGQALITGVSPTDGGAHVSITPDGRSLRYVPRHGAPDRFTYVVDGKYEASVYASIRSHLMADEFIVDQNSQLAPLAPLDNDFPDNPYGTQFSCGAYLGLRRITSVSPTAHGGLVTIVNGLDLTYTPPADFVGQDRFTYTVDGVMQAPVTVEVIRRVRDDVYRVDINSKDNHIPVLVNDLFGADYREAGQITEVTATTAGGAVTIADNGKSIVYTPAADFEGLDTFIYTVDGTLKAEVIVRVGTSATDAWPRFSSLADLEDYLLDQALTLYADLFGQRTHDWLLAGARDDSFHRLLLNESADRLYSDTNVQVAGVDEGDIIENDGDYLYILADGELVIANAWPAEDMSVLSRTRVEGNAIAEFLHGNRLAIISHKYSPIHPPPPVVEPFLLDSFYLAPQHTDTWLTIFDVSNRREPRLVQATLLDGEYVESRRIDDFIFLVLRNDDVRLPRPEINPVSDIELSYEGSPEPWLPYEGFVYESREQYIDRMRAQMSSLVEDILPQFTSFGSAGELTRTGLLHTPEDLYRPLSEHDSSLVSVVSVNIGNNEPGISTSSGIFTSGADKIYGSIDNLYVFDDRHTTEDGNTTQILKFRWSGETGDVQFVAKGHVAGQLLNQFSADEFQDHLRIATTIANVNSGNFSRRPENTLFVLRDDEGILEFVGGLKNLALGETIRSVRYFGERAFVTTFHNIDPLFAVDLSDPATPVSVGHVTMPGYSSYMQLIDGRYMLAVGRNTPTGFGGPTQVSLFDVQDLSHPRLVDQYTFERFSTSEAEADHHAFGWFATHQALAVPSVRGYWQRVDADRDGYRESRQWVTYHALVLLQIDTLATQPGDGAIQLRGELEHDSPVRRSAFIEDVLYSVADNSTIAVDIHDTNDRLAEVRYDLLDPPASGIDAGTAHDDRANVAEAIDRTRVHLAETKGLDLGQIVASTAEAARWKDETITADADPRDGNSVPGFRVVLDGGEHKYLYHTDLDETVVLVDDSFEFALPQVVWHNQARPLDVSDDLRVTPRDALLVVNDLNQRGARQLAPDPVSRMIHSRASYLLDVNDDGYLSPRDALLIVNQLNAQAADSAEAEGEAKPFTFRGDPQPNSAWHNLRHNLRSRPRTRYFADHTLATDARITPLVGRALEADIIGLVARDIAARTSTGGERQPPSDLWQSWSWLEIVDVRLL